MRVRQPDDSAKPAQSHQNVERNTDRFNQLKYQQQTVQVRGNNQVKIEQTHRHFAPEVQSHRHISTRACHVLLPYFIREQSSGNKKTSTVAAMPFQTPSVRARLRLYFKMMRPPGTESTTLIPDKVPGGCRPEEGLASLRAFSVTCIGMFWEIAKSLTPNKPSRRT